MNAIKGGIKFSETGTNIFQNGPLLAAPGLAYSINYDHLLILNKKPVAGPANIGLGGKYYVKVECVVYADVLVIG